jgi:hypothetical protein
MKTIATTEPWAKADLLFLEDAIRRGLSAMDVAGFLGRTADEAQAKARELGEANRGPRLAARAAGGSRIRDRGADVAFPSRPSSFTKESPAQRGARLSKGRPCNRAVKLRRGITERQ